MLQCLFTHPFLHPNRMPTLHAGADYLVNRQNPSSRIFTVLFQSKQANSSEHVIQIAEDNTFEGSESFRLRIIAARFSGQAAVFFRAQDELNSTVADVNIADDDSKFRNSVCTICLQIVMKKTYAYVHLMHCFLQLYSSIGQYHNLLM